MPGRRQILETECLSEGRESLRVQRQRLFGSRIIRILCRCDPSAEPEATIDSMEADADGVDDVRRMYRSPSI
jgi:hypothetical protein